MLFHYKSLHELYNHPGFIGLNILYDKHNKYPHVMV